MASLLYKWLIVFALGGFASPHHPIFVSVTEIALNAKNKTLEISCKIFTDDFETALRKQYKTKVDLLDAKFKSAMDPLVNDYIQKHLSIIADSKQANLQFLGFEQQEEGIVGYYEVKNISAVKKMDVVNNILYELHARQMGIIHVTANGVRKSRRLDNPVSIASFLL